MIEITYTGKWISLNELYSKNRYVANKIKTEWKYRFKQMLLDAQATTFTEFAIELRYWSRLDVDNVEGGLKVLVDTLRAEGYVENDDKRYYKGIHKQPDSSLPHNTYQIKIYTDDELKIWNSKYPLHLQHHLTSTLTVMALDFAEVQRVLEEAAKADNNRKEIRKGLGKVHSLIQALDIALGEVISMVDADAPAPKERKPYSGKPRGRKPKNASADGELFTGVTADNTALTPEDAAQATTDALKDNADARESLNNTIEEVTKAATAPKKAKAK